MKNNYKYLILFTLAFFIWSCDKKDDFVNENSKTVEVAGDWFVQHNHNVYGIDPFGKGFINAMTFNTSSDVSDSIWLTDDGHFWDYKVKVPCNVTDLTFGGSDTVVNAVSGYPIKVVVRNGKIMKSVSKQPSGFVADSIYYEIWFEDLAGSKDLANNVYLATDTIIVSGFRRTGFVEDEH